MGALHRLVALMAPVGLLAGCSSDSPPAPLPESGPAAASEPAARPTGPAEPSDPSVIWRPTPPRNGAEIVVLLAYKRYWVVAQRNFRTPNPADPEIAEVAAGPLYEQLAALVADARRQGVVDRGTVVFTPRVGSITGNRATVIDCIDSRNQADYDRSGRLIPDSHGSRFRTAFAIVRGRDRTWTAFDRKDLAGAC